MSKTNSNRRERFFVHYKAPQIFWFRIYGYGISMTNYKHGFVPFSVRYGYKRTLCFFGYYIEFLKPTKH